MRVYSYVVAVDSGFAPNPFWDVLTLACCKPQIRRHAEPGDVIVGLTSRARGNGMVYVAKVAEKLTFEQYWGDPRFRRKRPDMTSSRTVDRCGDNIYEALGGRRFRQLPSGHSNGEFENPESKEHDLGGRHVLVSRDFSYFGGEALPLPEALGALVVGRAHRCRFPEATVEEVERWRQTLPRGVRSSPYYWRDGDRSWRACR
ncbi:MAG: hypothetical protein AB7O28_10680 [Vicinamibacterales bacterium]